MEPNEPKFAINGTDYALVEKTDGSREWQTVVRPGDESDIAPWRESAGFGAWGLGSSVPAVRNQFHRGFRIDAEHWGFLAPGFKQFALGLPLSTMPSKILTIRAGQGVSVSRPTPASASSSGSPAWTSPTNVFSSDAARAVTTLTALQTSGQLSIHNYAGAASEAPRGVTASIQADYTGDLEGATLRVRLRSAAGSPIGAAKTIILAPTEQYYTLGGPSDLWGTGVSLSDVNDTDFGLVVEAIAPPIANVPLTLSPSAPDVVATTGSVTNPSNALVIDGTLSDSSIAGHGLGVPVENSSGTWELTDFDFVIPSGRAILGLKLSVRVSADPTSGGAFGFSPKSGVDVKVYAQLRQNAANLGAERLVGTFKNGAGLTTLTLGDEDDLWGVALSEAILEDVDFGVKLRMASTFQDDDLTGPETMPVHLDGATLQPTHETPASGTVRVNHASMVVHGFTQPRKFLYVASGNQLAKVSFGTENGVPEWTLEHLKTFTHGDSTTTPQISDVVAARSGESPGAGFILVGFEGEAQIEQVDSVTPTGADGYGTKSGTKAYAGVFGKMVGAGNLTRLWRSQAAAGETSGAFSRISSAAVDETTIDYTDPAAWSDNEPFKVGNFETRASAIFEWQNALAVIKTEGLYLFGEDFASYRAYSMETFESRDNGKGSVPFGTGMLIPHLAGLSEYPPQTNAQIGIETLWTNDSDITGRCMRVAPFGDNVFAAYYNGVDSYILKMRRQLTEQVPSRYLFYPFEKVQGAAVEALWVDEDDQGTTWFFYGAPGASGGYDVRASILDPPSMRRYQGGGEFETTRVGDAGKISGYEQLFAYGDDCDDENYWQIDVAVDNGPYVPVGASEAVSRVNQDGRVRFVPVRGQNDTGSLFRFRYTVTIATDTSRPKLVAVSVPGVAEEGGLYIQGHREGDPLQTYTFVIQIEEGMRDRLTRQLKMQRTPTVVQALLNLQGQVVDIIHTDEWGDETPRSLRVEEVSEVYGRKEWRRDSGRFVRFTVRELLGD